MRQRGGRAPITASYLASWYTKLLFVGQFSLAPRNSLKSIDEFETVSSVTRGIDRQILTSTIQKVKHRSVCGVMIFTVKMMKQMESFKMLQKTL